MAYLDLDFDSFKIPLATKNSLLATSSEDVNVVDDATNEVTQDATVANGNDLKSKAMPLVVYLNKFILF